MIKKWIYYIPQVDKYLLKDELDAYLTNNPTHTAIEQLADESFQTVSGNRHPLGSIPLRQPDDSIVYLTASGDTVSVKTGELTTVPLSTDSSLTSYSGFAESRFVNTSGDAMSGFLTLNDNPTLSGHASNKSYVDTKAKPKQLSYNFAKGVTNNSTTYTSTAIFPFEGTNSFGPVLSVSGVFRTASITTSGQARLFNLTTNTELATTAFFSGASTANLLVPFTISGGNFPSSGVLLDLQVRRTSGSNANITVFNLDIKG
jgi:hypothetical protein